MIKSLIGELKQVKKEHLDEEQLQIRLLSNIDLLMKDNNLKQIQMKVLREQIDQTDQSNIDLRKEIEYFEELAKTKKKESAFTFKELHKVRTAHDKIELERT